MSLAIAGWQILIFLTIVISGRAFRLTAGLWIIWTFFQIYTLPLSFVQFATILIAYLVAKSRNSVKSDKEHTLVNDALEIYLERREQSSIPLWPMYAMAGGMFLLTQILPTSDSEQHQPSTEPVQSQNSTYSNPEKKGAHSFTVIATPSNARVRIMNIKPKYHDGMELESGDYDVLVDAAGYHNWRQTIHHDGEATRQHVTLKRKAVFNEGVEQGVSKEENKDAINNSLIDGRYRDNRDGTVTDIKTKLQWMRCSVGQSWNGQSCAGRPSGNRSPRPY